VVGVDGRAIGSVVTERRLVADESAGLVLHRAVAAAMACGERDARGRVDESQCAGVRALDDFHPRGHHDTGICLRRHTGKSQRDERSRHRGEYA
jgi:hypothetical protein